MLTLLTLLLNAGQPSLDHLTLAERNLLQSAVHTQHTFQIIEQYFEQCQSLKEYQRIGLPDLQQHRSVIEAKLNISYQDFLFANQHAESWQQLKPRDTVKAAECVDNELYQQYIDQYEIQRFSLEIATPLTKPLLTNPAANQKQQNQQVLLNSYLQRSSTVAIATVSDRQLLSAVEQANFLHLDYKSRYIFRINQGWRNITPRFIGMHVQINDQDLAKYEGDWLIFLDQQRQFISATPVKNATAFIKDLGLSDWQIDNNGNLQRRN